MISNPISNDCTSHLARLRASRDSAIARRAADGEAAGKRWASNAADFEQLERISAIDIDAHEADDSGTLAMAIAEAITDESESPTSAEQLLRELDFGNGKSGWPGFHHARGFVFGAREVFDEV